MNEWMNEWMTDWLIDLIKYSDNQSGTTESLFQYHKDEAKNPITDSNSFKFKWKFLAKTNECGNVNGEITMQLKYATKFCRTFEKSLINCESNFTLT